MTTVGRVQPATLRIDSPAGFPRPAAYRSTVGCAVRTNMPVRGHGAHGAPYGSCR
jgi:hypothetical protein